MLIGVDVRRIKQEVTMVRVEPSHLAKTVIWPMGKLMEAFTHKSWLTLKRPFSKTN